MESLRDMAQSSKNILVPKSRDAADGLRAFTEATGIEIPDTIWEDELAYSAGRSFLLVPGRDMASRIAAGFGDIAIGSTELAYEYGEQSTTSLRLSNIAMCRYSILALNEVADAQEQELRRSSRYPTFIRSIPAAFPKLLNQAAAVLDIPIVADEVSVTGKMEAFLRRYNIPMGADRVVSGATAAKCNEREIFTLMQIYPELIVRRKDADAYRPNAT